MNEEMKLRPCPFCGPIEREADKPELCGDPNDDYEGGTSVVCGSCGTKGPIHDDGTDWNRRAPDEQVARLVAAAKETAEFLEARSAIPSQDIPFKYQLGLRAAVATIEEKS